jgi:hypothetical protein
MNTPATTTAANRGSSSKKKGRTPSEIIPKYPPYGKQLAERIQFKNSPTLIIINVGGDAWQRAKNWQRHSDFAALVLTAGSDPKQLIWPVKSCPCFLEWGKAAPESLIIELVVCLLRSGAIFVTVIPLFVDLSTPAEYFDTDSQKWIKARESKKIYYPKEVRHVAR